jgi:hypothetical protein
MFEEIEDSHTIVVQPSPPKDDGGFLPQLDEIYFTTVEKKFLENYRYIVPNFMDD